VSDVLDLSALDNLLAPSLPILFTELRKNEMKHRGCTPETEYSERCVCFERFR
jgi:hypothetical protein